MTGYACQAVEVVPSAVLRTSSIILIIRGVLTTVKVFFVDIVLVCLAGVREFGDRRAIVNFGYPAEVYIERRRQRYFVRSRAWREILFAAFFLLRVSSERAARG